MSSTKRPVLGAIRRYLHPELRHSVDDVAQEVYIRFFRFMEKHGQEGLRMESLGSLAFVMARNESIRFNQKHMRGKAAESEAAYRFRPVEPVEVPLDFLLPEFKAVVDLTLQGYSVKEIALQLGIPVGTVKSRLHRARQVLRKEHWN